MYKNLLCGPFVKDFDGTKSDGYLFIRSYDVCNPFFKMKKEEHWYLMPNGSFIYINDSGQDVIAYEGTFDSSKYDEYVSLMKEYRTEWINELSYETKMSYKNMFNN